MYDTIMLQKLDKHQDQWKFLQVTSSTILHCHNEEFPEI